jgi:hypothetical protein
MVCWKLGPLHVYNNITQMRGSKLPPSTAVTDGVRYWLWVIPACIYNYNIFFRQCLYLSQSIHTTKILYMNDAGWGSNCCDLCQPEFMDRTLR